MKNNNLAHLEAALTNEKSVIVQVGNNELQKEANRFIAMPRKEKTHVLRLNMIEHKLYWRNNRGKNWEHQFISHEQASAWWKNIIMPRATVEPK